MACTPRLGPQLRGPFGGHASHWQNLACVLVNKSSINGAHYVAALTARHPLHPNLQFMYYNHRQPEVVLLGEKCDYLRGWSGLGQL